MSPVYETLIWQVDDDGIATLTINRPDALNAFDLTMARELLEVFTTDANRRTIVYALQASVVRMEPLVCARRAKTARWRAWLRPLSLRGALAAA